MASLDTSKLTRLRAELGYNTTVVCELVEEFAAGAANVRRSSTSPMGERADIVHQFAGTAAMLAPEETLVGLNHLEQKLRDGDAAAVGVSHAAMCGHLDEVLQAFEAWVENAPADGEPSAGEFD